MAILTIRTAVRTARPVFIAIHAYSGGGKTLSGLLMARGLVGPDEPIGLLDTEKGRALDYADEPKVGGFQYAQLSPPFTPARYIEALSEFEAAGVKALVVDSTSHEWGGEGGVLELASESKWEGLKKWSGPKAAHKKFLDRLLNSNIHLILCLRSKEKMIQRPELDEAGNQVRDNRGRLKNEIVSAGFVPIQEKTFIFEMTVQLFMPVPDDKTLRGIPVIEKCPGMLMGAFPPGQKITVETGRMIAEWVKGGKPIDKALLGLQRAGEAEAAKGTEAFTAWWNSKEIKPTRDQLRPFIDNFKSIAAAADEEVKARAAAGPDDREEVDDSGSTAGRATDMEDPFKVGNEGGAAPAAPARTEDAAGEGERTPPTPAGTRPWTFTSRDAKAKPVDVASMDGFVELMRKTLAALGFAATAVTTLMARNAAQLERLDRTDPDACEAIKALARQGGWDG